MASSLRRQASLFMALSKSKDESKSQLDYCPIEVKEVVYGLVKEQR
jgi:hypothetical protein